MSRSSWSLTTALAVVLAACGGAENPGPKPLQYHFKEQNIARVPVERKQEMLDAQTAYNRAKQEKLKAEADLDDSKTRLDVARNEASQASLAKDSAESKKSAADKNEDNNQKNLAMRDERVAEVTLRAARQKVTMLEARRAWLKKYARYTEENLYASEARYELAKAKVAKGSNIAPPDFAFQAYADQQEERRRRAERARAAADHEKTGWLAAQKEFEAKKRDENEARGIDTASSTHTKPPVQKK